MDKVLITGGSGLIGRSLTVLLQQRGYEVAWLSRGSKAPNGVKVFNWDVSKGKLDDKALQWANVLVHLAGEGIADKRWTSKRKQKIIESRTKSTQLLVDGMNKNKTEIHTVVAASAIGFYGETNGESGSEDAKTGSGFLSESVSLWESATKAFESTGARLVTVRIGLVLTSEGGALKEIVQTKGLRVLPIMGNGKQIYSWIHIADVIAIMCFAIEHPITGIYNAVAPKPVSQKDLLKAYQKAQNKWFLLFPVPVFGLRLVLGEMSDAVLINQNISAKKITEAGFIFQFPDINKALGDIINSQK